MSNENGQNGLDGRDGHDGNDGRATPAANRNPAARAGGRKRKRSNGAVPRSVSFWGQPGVAAGPIAPIEPSADATAVVTSLGPPPLAGQETAAVHYFVAVYAKAVGGAGALAAAAGLLETNTDENSDAAQQEAAPAPDDR
jgi:hypothetical protein